MHSLLSRRTPPVELYTYDDLRNLLDFQRLQLLGGTEAFAGLSISLVLAVDPSPDGSPAVVFDFGVEDDRNRITLRAFGHGLALEVKDARGMPHVASIPFDPESFLPGEYFYLSLQLGCEAERGLLLVEVNGRCSAEHRLTNLHFDPEPFAFVIGSDLNGKSFAHARLAMQMIGNATQSFQERANTRRLVFTYYEELFRTGRGRQTMQMKGRHSMFSNGHPRFMTAPDVAHPPFSLVQPDPELQLFLLRSGADPDYCPCGSGKIVAECHGWPE